MNSAKKPDQEHAGDGAGMTGAGGTGRTAEQAGVGDVADLQRIVLRRLSDFADDAARRVEDQTVLEPLGWIEGCARLWSGVVDDLVDFARSDSGQDLRPSEQWIPRYRRSLTQGDDRLTCRLEVPRSVYYARGAGAAPERGVTLVTDGFSRPGQPNVLKPGCHFEFVPSFVDYIHRRADIRFIRLPSNPSHPLQVGSYVAVVWAEETEQVAFILQLDVVLGES